MASPLFIAEASPLAIAIGIIPITIAIVVINIGLRRAWFACIRALKVVSPSDFLWLAKSTKRMAFLATRPINIMIPNIVKMLIDSLVSANPHNAPIRERGMENITIKGRLKSLYRITIII